MFKPSTAVCVALVLFAAIAGSAQAHECATNLGNNGYPADDYLLSCVEYKESGDVVVCCGRENSPFSLTYTDFPSTFAVRTIENDHMKICKSGADFSQLSCNPFSLFSKNLVARGLAIAQCISSVFDECASYRYLYPDTSGACNVVTITDSNWIGDGDYLKYNRMNLWKWIRTVCGSDSTCNNGAGYGTMLNSQCIMNPTYYQNDIESSDSCELCSP